MDRLTRLELTADELHLLVLMAERHCFECFPERMHRRMDKMSKALARLEAGEEVRD